MQTEEEGEIPARPSVRFEVQDTKNEDDSIRLSPFVQRIRAANAQKNIENQQTALKVFNTVERKKKFLIIYQLTILAGIMFGVFLLGICSMLLIIAYVSYDLGPQMSSSWYNSTCIVGDYTLENRTFGNTKLWYRIIFQVTYMDTNLDFIPNKGGVVYYVGQGESALDSHAIGWWTSREDILVDTRNIYVYNSTWSCLIPPVTSEFGYNTFYATHNAEDMIVMDFSDDDLDTLNQAFNIRLGFGLVCGIIGLFLFLGFTTTCLINRKQVYGPDHSNWRQMNGLLLGYEGRLSVEMNLLSG